MELKEFIKCVISQVTDAVKESQEEVQNGAVIVPNEEIEGEIRTKSSRKYVSMLKFNIELTTTSSDKAEKGIHVLSSIIGGKYDCNENTESGKSTRIEFSIPIILPVSL